MQVINLKIDDSFFPHFKAIIDSFVKDCKVEIVENEAYDYGSNYPKSLIVNSVKEVRKRVFEAEHEEGVSEEEYERVMNKFFEEELGIKR